jgi:glyoxalase family protein
MPQLIHGLHHITAIAGDPQQNLDFYTHALGLRLVKLTVNYDDPRTYHFYFGDSTGSPGTIISFYPWDNAQRGQVGLGQTNSVAFLVPPGSLGFWQERLKKYTGNIDKVQTRFDEELLTFTDPHGLPIELVAREDAVSTQFWAQGPISEIYAIRGFAGPTLLTGSLEKTGQFLNKLFGMVPDVRSGNRFRFSFPAGGPNTHIDLLVNPDFPRGRVGAGVVHHVAWNVRTDNELDEWRRRLMSKFFQVSAIQDRNYYRSIYFREPGGVVFEIATEEPGFTLDETEGRLGSNLMLPTWLEPRRQTVIGSLPQLFLPNGISALRA